MKSVCPDISLLCCCNINVCSRPLERTHTNISHFYAEVLLIQKLASAVKLFIRFEEHSDPWLVCFARCQVFGKG